MKILVASILVSVPLLISGEPDPHGVVAAVPVHTHSWPAHGVVGPYGAHESTCYGCRPHVLVGLGKRSAEPSPHGIVGHVHVGPVVGVHHPTGHSFQSGSNVVGAGLGLTGIAGFHHHHGKRSAEPEPHGAFLGGHVHGTTTGIAAVGVGHSYQAGANIVGTGVYGHPGVLGRHFHGKRSAQPEPHGASAYVGRTIWGFPRAYGHVHALGHHHHGKRSAEPQPHGATSYVGPTVWGFPHVHGHVHALGHHHHG